MSRSILSKAMRIGRATVFLVGLSAMLALAVRVASAAVAGKGGFFILAENSVTTAVSKLVQRGPGPALGLRARRGEPPMKVNSSKKVTNFNADKLDGKTASDFYAARSKVKDSRHADGADSTRGADSANRVGALEAGAGEDPPLSLFRLQYH